MAELAVRATGVGKRYTLGQHSGYQLLSEVIAERARRLRGTRPPRQRLWALRDLSFEVARGETFGIVGHNGAGKSTLLKLLSRVTPPTEGAIELRGRVGALLEVGTGFHPELTGRENVFLNGAILGMGRTEIQAKFDEIVDFAEVRRFVDTPVKRYSSGMYLRLAFAVAAHLEPDILVIDEVLAVGDLAFQEKCLGRMERAAGEGRTVLFVSHNLAAVRNLCPRSMLLSQGRKVAEGPTDAVLESYVRSIRADAGRDLRERADRQGSGRYRFTSIALESGGEPVDAPVTGRDLDIALRYETADGASVRNATFAVSVYNLLGVHVLQCQSDLVGAAFRDLPANGEVRCRLPRLPLPGGRYTLNVFGTAGGDIADWVQRAYEVTVADGDFYGTGRLPPEGHRTVLVDQRWELREAAPAADALAPAARRAS
jgi:lipopolysaccharide transport system ATP-binding protein